MATQAKKKITKTRPGSPAQPVKMVKLVGGSERPETAGDRNGARLTAKAQKRKPDGANAFHLASDMEDDLNEIERLMDALHLMAEGANADDRRMSSALYGIFNSLETTLRRPKRSARRFSMRLGVTSSQQNRKCQPLLWRISTKPSRPSR